MSSVTEATFPAMTGRERDRIERRVIAEGLSCSCGRPATSEQIERWLEEFARDPQPFAWSCEDDVHYCSTCKGAGAPKGAGAGAVCWQCSGDGEVREVSA